MKQFKRIGVLLLLCLFFLSPFALLHIVSAETETPTPTSSPTPSTTVTPTPDTSGKLNDLQNKIRELEGKIIDLQAQEKTLSSQIAVMENQERLTQLRINATEEEIEELTRDIQAATMRITKLENSLDDLTEVLIKRIVATYELGSIPPIHVLFTSNDVTDLFNKANYLRIAQEHDKKLMYDTLQAKNDYENQKTIFEGKKQKIEVLKAQLDTYKKQLEVEKKNKQDLLAVTKNDEQKYQSLLAQVRAERDAIEGAVASLQLKDGTPVSAGQVIALVGNSGAPVCSTGPHLHFEVRKNGAIDNPNSYLKPGVTYNYSYGSDDYDKYGTVNPSGSWDWPLSEPIRINQGFGSHSFARYFYPSGIHTGIDMDSTSSLIKAPKDGTLYKGVTSCGSSTLKYAAIDHGEGIVSWYWHVQ